MSLTFFKCYFLNVLYDFNHCFEVYIITKLSHPYSRLCVITVVTRIMVCVYSI